MAALSLCLFDIWPERTAGMKRTCARKDGVESGWMGLFISCLAEYTTCVKKRKKKKEKGNERQTRRNSTHDVKTEVFE